MQTTVNTLTVASVGVWCGDGRSFSFRRTATPRRSFSAWLLRRLLYLLLLHLTRSCLLHVGMALLQMLLVNLKLFLCVVNVWLL